MLAIIYVVLSVLVTRQRVKHRVPLGAGNSPALERAIRVHANFAEYVPVALVLMLVYELNTGRTRTVAIYGACLVAARVLHAMGLSYSHLPNPMRFIGTVLTWMIVIGLAAVNILYCAQTILRLES